VYVSGCAEQTRLFGEALGRCARRGDLIALVGGLGSGKTVLVSGVARGLEVDPTAPVSSPTFTIVHRYLGRLPLYHIDLYRLDAPEALLDLGLEEYLEGDGVAAVEWAEHGERILPRERLTVTLRQTGAQTREIELWPVGDRYRALIRCLADEAASGASLLAVPFTGERTDG
jgi:tRNA threonylcarbamoyladenosine biosynthesis protein TsaE